jgi:tRNA 2-thiocytidine biosynthesis protein TtcA
MLQSEDASEINLMGLHALVQDTLTRRGNKLSQNPEAAEQSAAHAAKDQLKHDWDAMPVGKLERRITRSVGKAIADFRLIEEGDRILVAISGGKDSWALLHILNEMRKRAPVHYEIVAANIDQGYAGFRQDIIEDYVDGKGYEYHMEFFNTAKLIEEKTAPGSTPCSLCARMRRGLLYGLAEKHRCNKIALGHHLDDFIETLLLNTFFVGRMASMAPKLISDDGKNMVIRPLVYVGENEIKAYVKKMEFPIVCCACPIMCGETVHGDYKRRMVKKMIAELEPVIPHIRQSLISSLGNVQPSHLLDTDLWDFKNAATTPAAEPVLPVLDLELEA